MRTKQPLREKVYFSVIDKAVEKMCKSYVPCLAATKKQTQEPLSMSKIPDYALQEVIMDFCGPFPDEKYLLFLVDEYSRFPFVESISSICGNTVIPMLDKVFSEVEIPKTLKSDNGSPMNSPSELHTCKLLHGIRLFICT